MNGITVVVQENPASPTLALRASLPAGHVLDPADKSGLASLTAAMLIRGTGQRSALAFATQLEDVGASLSASADALATMISGRAESRDFDRLMDLLADMLRHPEFPAAELGRLKGEALAQLAQARDDPDSAAERAFGRAIYPAGPPSPAADLRRGRGGDRQDQPRRSARVPSPAVRPRRADPRPRRERHGRPGPGGRRDPPRRLAAEHRRPSPRPRWTCRSRPRPIGS